MATIKVNDQQWNALSTEEQEKIFKGLVDTGAIKNTDEIVGDPDEAKFTEDTQMEPMWNPLEDLCKHACDVAATAGFAWCEANTGGAAHVACVAAAEAARRACRNRC